MSIRFGGRPVEFEKGKSAVSVASKDKLPTVIRTLVEAVRAGELDDILAQAKRPGFGKVKRAA
jgi:MoaA/NifB/PqqE/SkfB family radical SAM enzyme